MIKINFNNLKKTFITAEIGINHNGDEKRALKIIQIAAKSGVDAVKLQTFMTDDYISVDSKERYERTKKFELNRNFFNEILYLINWHCSPYWVSWICNKYHFGFIGYFRFHRLQIYPHEIFSFCLNRF